MYFPAVTSFFQGFTSFWHNFDIQPEKSGVLLKVTKSTAELLSLPLLLKLCRQIKKKKKGGEESLYVLTSEIMRMVLLPHCFQ